MIYEITPGGVLDQDYLMHHGIKGQKWGVRRFQNPDGSLTPEGIRKYNQYKEKYGEKTAARLMRSMNKGDSEKRAMQREYNRRRYGNMGRKLAIGSAISAPTGAAIGVAEYSLVKNGIVDGDTARSIFPMISGIVGGAIAIPVNKWDKKMDGYSKFDISKEGLQKFYDDMKNARDD